MNVLAEGNTAKSNDSAVLLQLTPNQSALFLYLSMKNFLLGEGSKLRKQANLIGI
jgi:hypothetical protein